MMTDESLIEWASGWLRENTAEDPTFRQRFEEGLRDELRRRREMVEQLAKLALDMAWAVKGTGLEDRAKQLYQLIVSEDARRHSSGQTGDRLQELERLGDLLVAIAARIDDVRKSGPADTAGGGHVLGSLRLFAWDGTGAIDDEGNVAVSWGLLGIKRLGAFKVDKFSAHKLAMTLMKYLSPSRTAAEEMLQSTSEAPKATPSR